MNQGPRAFDMTEKVMPESGATGRAFNQARDVGQNKSLVFA